MIENPYTVSACDVDESLGVSGRQALAEKKAARAIANKILENVITGAIGLAINEKRL
jgi:hypothetical protein